MIECFTEPRVDGDVVAQPRKRKPKPGFLSSRDRWLLNTLRNVEYRCTNPRDKRFKNYGARGIKCFLTIDDLQRLYERDRPDLMLRPSIDRIENEGHYQFTNCRFLELLDNIARSKRRPYPCENCGAVALPKYRNGRKLCGDCNKADRLGSIKYPAYVQYAIIEASKRGLTVEGALNPQYVGSRTFLFINGHKTKIHLAAKASATGGKTRYWRFNIEVDTQAPFHVLVAQENKRRHIFIFVQNHETGCMYVPVKEEDRRKRHPLSIRDWQSLKDAWHLLGAAPAIDEAQSVPAEERQSA